MNEIATTTQQNPFTSAQIMARPSTGNAVAMTDQSRAVAEVQAAMMIARMNPRDQIAAMDRILNACSRATLADVAVYQYSRGGTDITGPSIRLAESIAQNWGNLQFGIRELDQRNGESTVQAYAWDVETNTRREVTFQIPHTRYTRKGSYKLEDPRDIYEMVANQGSRRLRACILAVVPGDVVEAAVNQCELTMKAKADTSPDALKKMVDAFAAFGVTKEQIEKRIQRRLDAIQPAQMVGLKKIYTSLRDGMSTPADWFEHEEEKNVDAGGDTPNKNATDSLKQKLQHKPSTTTTAQTESPQSGAPEQTDPPPPETKMAAEKAPVKTAPPPAPGAASPGKSTEAMSHEPPHPAAGPEPQTQTQAPDEAPKISEVVKKYMREINQASTGGSIAMDTWRMKHIGRVLKDCGGDQGNADFIHIRDYAQMVYDECKRAEADATTQNQTTRGPQNGKLF